MSVPRTLALVAFTLTLAGCVDAALPTEPAPEHGAVAAAAAPASSGVVDRFTTVNGLIFHDARRGLTALLGLDRAAWCAAGGDLANLADFLSPLENMRVAHPNGRFTLTIEQEDELLVVYQGIDAVDNAEAIPVILSCVPLTVVGEGRGSFGGTIHGPVGDANPPRVSNSHLHGAITVDGSVRSVSASALGWIGFRSGELVRVLDARVVLAGLDPPS